MSFTGGKKGVFTVANVRKKSNLESNNCRMKIALLKFTPLLASLFFVGSISYAQPTVPTTHQPPSQQPASDTAERMFNQLPPGGGMKEAEPADGKNGSWLLTSKETLLAFSVLISLFIIIIIEVWLIYKMKISDDNSTKLIIITLVLMGTLFIVMAGYDERVIAPVFGLFGTIVGYLFGKTANKE